MKDTRTRFFFFFFFFFFFNSRRCLRLGFHTEWALVITASLQRHHLFIRMMLSKWIFWCKKFFMSRIICKKVLNLFLFPHSIYIYLKRLSKVIISNIQNMFAVFNPDSHAPATKLILPVFDQAEGRIGLYFDYWQCYQHVYWKEKETQGILFLNFIQVWKSLLNILLWLQNGTCMEQKFQISLVCDQQVSSYWSSLVATPQILKSKSNWKSVSGVLISCCRCCPNSPLDS